MRDRIRDLVSQALATLSAEGVLPADAVGVPVIERTRDEGHGDFATNAALVSSKAADMKPRDLAQRLVDALPVDALVAKVEIAGPGFVNFFMSPRAYRVVVPEILIQGHDYGRSDLGRGKRVQVEFVSANPTGPLHVGHGRGAAYGAVVADLLAAVGFDVQREYYVNDAGRQMDILGTSVWLRYLELCGEDFAFPSNGYKGDYVLDIAATLHRERGDDYRHGADLVFDGIAPDEPDGGDKEEHIDALIQRAKQLLGDNRYRYVFELGLNTILDDIRDDLGLFGVTYQQWYSERSLVESGAVNKVIDIWGADHHGYVPRVRAALEAIGDDPSKMDVLLVQFAVLYRGGEKVQMSTRSGEFVTLRQLRKEVGSDAARYFYVMRKCEQHLDFDLDLAKSQSTDNPVYYVQYAHARICSVLRQAAEKSIAVEPSPGEANLELLQAEHEEALLKLLARYPEVVESAALNEEPHQVVHYLRDLANGLHTYYNAQQFLVEDAPLRDARIKLILATREVLRNGLNLLGVSAPEAM